MSAPGISRPSKRAPDPDDWSPVDPPRQPVLFVNPRSGGGAAGHAGVVERARSRGIEVVLLEPGQSLGTFVDQAVAEGADALGMAGGDGSLAVVAAAAEQHGIPFVCVPAGTRNHFALDVGVDRHDLVGALEAFTDGVERLNDVGSVNGRLFLNNVSLGIYGEAVRKSAYCSAKAQPMSSRPAAGTGHAAQARQRLPWRHRPRRAGHQPDACASVDRDVA